MDKDFEIIYPFNKNLSNDIQSYKNLIKLYHLLNSEIDKSVLLDFTKVSFLSANLLAVLGCCVDNIISSKKHRIAIRNLHPKIKEVMRKNGFNKYFTWDNLDDTYHSTMDYAIFEATTEHLVDFEHYLLLNVFSRNNLPTMNSTYQNSIIDNLLEMFNNVIDHAESSSVYVCGQYFPKNSNLSFTIVDLGKTIFENVNEYLCDHNIEIPENTLKWAIIPGNSTKTAYAPGGIGFSTLLEFLKLNKGFFTLISDNELYEIRPGKERFNKLTLSFPGTIVTITINLLDEQFYLLDKENNDLIIF